MKVLNSDDDDHNDDDDDERQRKHRFGDEEMYRRVVIRPSVHGSWSLCNRPFKFISICEFQACT